ncbi:MAG: hypothetical protein IAE89_09805 [Anaerolineae bacterium]|nr:hypothetical protein [Anaerolineae bacterium]
MKETQALIQRVRRANSTHQRLDLSVDSSLLTLKAGQALLYRPDGDTLQPYLRDLWFPVDIDKDTLTIERPISEHYEPGSVIYLTGLIGKPFRFRRTLRNVLLVAHDTAPTPLLMPVNPLIRNQVSVTLLLLGDASAYETDHLPPEVEIIHGDGDFQWPARVTTVGWADQVFITVAPEAEIESFRRIWQLFTELRHDIPPSYLFGVFRPPFPCGVGACDACLVGTGKGAVRVCVEGPALDLTELKLQ